MSRRSGYNNLDEDERKIANSFLNTETGELFGGMVKVPKEIAVPAKGFIAFATQWLSTRGGEVLGKTVEGILARPFTGLSADRAQVIGRTSQKIFSYGLPYWEDIVQVGKTGYNYFSAHSALKKEVAPLQALMGKSKGGLGNFFSFGNENEMVRYAQSYITSQSIKKIGFQTTSVIERVPQAVLTYYHLKNHELEAAGMQGSDEYIKNKEMLGKFGSEMAIGGAGLAKAIVEEGFLKRKKGNVDDKPAWLLVKELQELVTDNLQSGKEMDNRRASRLNVEIAQQVSEIFQQHQRNMGRKEVPERLKEDFTELCNKIAERITDCDLDPMAIAIIASDGKIISKSGKSVMDPEIAEEYLDKMCEQFAQREPVNVQEALDEAPFTKEDLKASFAALGTERFRERAMLAALFEDGLLKEVGIKDDEITHLRKEIRTGIMEEVALAACEVAKLDAEVLKKEYKMSTQEIRTIQDFATKVERSGLDNAERALKGGAGKAVKTALRNMAVGTEEGAKTWTEIVNKEKTLAEPERLPKEKASTTAAGSHLKHENREQERSFER